LNTYQIISSVDLGGRRIIKKKKIKNFLCSTFKTEVAKVFMTTEIAHELVDPNPKDYEK